MKLIKYVLTGSLSCVALFAQGPPGMGRGPGRGFGPGGLGGFGPRGGKVVTGAPYSADVNFSRVETLQDGNVIQQTASGKFARDAQGRTYSMETLTGGPLGQNGPKTRVSIFDPVAGYAYELDASAKTAVRRAIHKRPAGALDAGPKGFGPDAASRPIPPDVVKTDLSVQIVNGVSAQGTKTTRTIPAGTIGNAMPIISTTETWYSADLQAVVSSTHSDPRAGQTKYALTNIVRTAPDAALFQVPAGYTVSDAKQGGRMGEFGHPGPPPPQEEE